MNVTVDRISDATIKVQNADIGDADPEPVKPDPEVVDLENKENKQAESKVLSPAVSDLTGSSEHMKKAIIIHGTFGSPDENWFPWLAEELRSKGYEVTVPKFPTPEGQNLKAWTEVFEKEVGKLDSDVTLIGHSLGVGFIAKLLSGSDTKIESTHLVSGFLGPLGLEEFDPLNASFVTGDFDWEKVRTNAGEVYVYNSDDDPYVPLEKGKELAKHLGTELIVVPNGGHINSSAGFDKFQLLLDRLSGPLRTPSPNPDQ